ncbi:MAG: transporter, partial [Muribaculaceae bacterium]|nr:transporter [Muribaculaceae bacterium]
ALLIPALVPLVHPSPGADAVTSALLILGKVFPLLLMPLAAAALVRRFLPSLHSALTRVSGVSFWLWTVALALALAVTARSIVHSTVNLSTQLWLVAVSLICCVIQFALGRMIGRRYGDAVTAGQSLGQKNTVLAIWIGYTFFSPITAIVGGFYSIWHNVINSWQLYRHPHRTQN